MTNVEYKEGARVPSSRSLFAFGIRNSSFEIIPADGVGE